MVEASPQHSLPLLISLRGWSEIIDAEYMRFVEELRASGCEVADVFVPHDGFATFGEWADASVEKALTFRRDNEPLHFLGYCGGGSLLTVGLRTLEQRGIHPEYVGFIDVRGGEPGFRLKMGFDSLYRVPWAMRIRFQLVRLLPPNRETFGAVAMSVLRHTVKSIIELPKRGWRSRKRRVPAVYGQAQLAANWENDSIQTPVHLYNCSSSVERYWPGDPSLGRAPLLRGGFSVQLIEGDHHSCLDPPNSSDLISWINRDRQASLLQQHTR